jgi:toxin-antitoxin system PIN domain toxin
MIVPDANLLIYAHNDADPEHEAAKRWWIGLLSGQERVGIPLAVAMAFLRLTTSPKVLAAPLEVERSIGIVESWFAYPHVQVLVYSEDHLSRFLAEVGQVGVAGNLTTDAHIATLAREYRATVHSTDSDFDRFDGLRWRNPLRG